MLLTVLNQFRPFRTLIGKSLRKKPVADCKAPGASQVPSGKHRRQDKNQSGERKNQPRGLVFDWSITQLHAGSNRESFVKVETVRLVLSPASCHVDLQKNLVGESMVVDKMLHCNKQFVLDGNGL
jgi:hypothetical protein